jgi:hypothetical protein
MCSRAIECNKPPASLTVRQKLLRTFGRQAGGFRALKLLLQCCSTQNRIGSLESARFGHLELPNARCSLDIYHELLNISRSAKIRAEFDIEAAQTSDS